MSAVRTIVTDKTGSRSYNFTTQLIEKTCKLIQILTDRETQTYYDRTHD